MTEDLLGHLAKALTHAREDVARCDVAFCDGVLRKTYRPAADGDVEPAAYCSRCGELAY